MKRRVIVKGLPKAQSGLESKLHNLRAGLGFNANTMPWPIMAGKLSEPPLQTNNTLQPVPREEANVEAERGEVAAMPTKSGIPDTKKIGGKRHYEGGTPLNLPTDTFIFSDTAKMRIKDPVILAQFGMPPRKNGYTPAEIAKKYDTTPYKKILMDKNADVMQQKTAEIMISNYNLKLAKLALYQESMKGFPQGIPAIAMPYIESMQLDPEMFTQANPGGMTDDETSESDMMSRFGGGLRRAQKGKIIANVVRDENYNPEDYIQPGTEEYGEANPIAGTDEIHPLLLGTEAYPYTFKGVDIVDEKLPEPIPGFDEVGQKRDIWSSDNQMEQSYYGRKTLAKKAKEDFEKKYPAYFNAYMSALNSNDPAHMKNIAKEFRKKEFPWYSASWFDIGPFVGQYSDENKFADLADVLEENAERILNPPSAQGEMFYKEFKNKDEEASKKVDKIYSEYLKKLNNLDKNSPEYLQALREKDEIFELTKDYKNLPTRFGKGILSKNQWEVPIGTGRSTENISPIGISGRGMREARMYSDDEYATINALYDKLFKKDEKIEPTSSASKADSSKVISLSTQDSLLQKQQEDLAKQVQTAAGVKDTSAVAKPAEKKKTYVTQKKSSSGPVKLKKKKIDKNKIVKKKGGSISGTRTVIVRATPKQTFANGGSVGLPKAQTGKIIPPNPDVYPVEWVEDDSTTPSKYYLEWSDGTYTNEQDTPPTSDQQAETRKVIAESKPSKKVTPEDYAKLKELYEKAKAKDPSASGVYTKEAEEFQELYHKLLPLEARRIIAKDPKPTAKCKGEEAYYNLDCNKDGRFGRRTVQYMEALEEIQKQEDPKTETTPGTTETKTEGTSTPLISEHLDERATRRYPPVPKTPFVQDVNNLNRAFLNYVGIQGFQPDLVQVPFQSPQLFFQSPERLLDENKSQMNIAANVLGKTRSPQDFYGGWSAIAGPGMTNAANIIANIHGQNINIANQEAGARSQAYGQNQGVNANFRKAFTDEVNAVKQNIYNSRLAGANEMTKAQNALITNMANKFNMNLLYPQFAVDEEGAAYFHDPRALKPEDQALAINQRYQKMLADNPVEAKTEEGKKRLWEMTKIEHGIASSTYDDPLSEYERAKKKGITPFMQYPGNSSE